MAESKKKSFFERLTGSMKIGDDEIFEEKESPKTKSRTARSHSMETNIEVTEEVDPFLHTYQDEEEDGELPVDVYHTDTEIIVQAFVAGVRPDELQITITRDSMTIKGKRQVSQKMDDNNYCIRELYWGSFSRMIDLPAEVEPEEAEAVEKHGLIIIKLPKIDKQKRASIRVKSI